MSSCMRSSIGSTLAFGLAFGLGLGLTFDALLICALRRFFRALNRLLSAARRRLCSRLRFLENLLKLWLIVHSC